MTKGIIICNTFYTQIVRDIVTQLCPSHGAGLIGPGSEVQGFDTEMSHDHDWYARCIIFVDGCSISLIKKMKKVLIECLPRKFMGFDVKVDVCTASDYFKNALGFDPCTMTTYDWLSTPNQILRELTSGAIWKSNNVLTDLREKLRFYPHDILMYILTAQWERVGQEMAFMGRNGETGDSIGSTLICSRLVTYIMRLCFLYERQYAPYWKWFGTAFSQLKCADVMMPAINAALSATDWKNREKHLSHAYTVLAEIHNTSGFTKPIEPRIVQYYTRPFFVPQVQEFKESLLNAMEDKLLTHLPKNIGAIDQITDQTDFFRA